MMCVMIGLCILMIAIFAVKRCAKKLARGIQGSKEDIIDN